VTAPAPTAPYPPALHDALPISGAGHLLDRGPSAPAADRRAVHRQEQERACHREEQAPEREALQARSGERAPDPTAEKRARDAERSEEHTSELQSRENLVCRLLL